MTSSVFRTLGRLATTTDRSDADEQLLALGAEWRRLSDALDPPARNRSDEDIRRMIIRIDEIAAAVAEFQAESPRGIMMKMEMASRHIGDRYDRGKRLAEFELPDRLAVAAMLDIAGLLALSRD